jgi:hypothetical protein
MIYNLKVFFKIMFEKKYLYDFKVIILQISNFPQHPLLPIRNLIH